MLAVMLVELLIAIVISLLGKVNSGFSALVGSAGSRMLKEFFLTLVFFNCLNISYAAAIYFKFNSNALTLLEVAACGFSLAALCFVATMLLSSESAGFG